MDDDLRNGLWNASYIHFLEDTSNYQELQARYHLTRAIWVVHFKHPLDGLGEHWEHAISAIRREFRALEWFEVYDFVESVAEVAEESVYSFNVDGLINPVSEELCSSGQ